MQFLFELIQTQYTQIVKEINGSGGYMFVIVFGDDWFGRLNIIEF